MAKSDAVFLEGLDEEVLRKQDAFLDNIAKRLGREQPLKTAPMHPFKGAPPIWAQMNLAYEERIQLFMANWQKAGGHTRRLSGMIEAQAFIESLIAETKAKNLIMQDQDELTQLRAELAEMNTNVTVWNSGDVGASRKDDLIAKAAGADIGIVAAEHAVAYTGSLVVTSDRSRGRCVSCCPRCWSPSCLRSGSPQSWAKCSCPSMSLRLQTGLPVFISYPVLAGPQILKMI